jgi:uncharacterized membrane protein
MQFLVVFVFTFISDAVWTFYISSVSDKKAMMAGIFSALVVLLGLTVTILVVNEPKHMVSAVIGAWSGTYLTMKWLNRKKPKQKEEQ